MTRIEYDCLRARRPELGLTAWDYLRISDRAWVFDHSEEEIVSLVVQCKLLGIWRGLGEFRSSFEGNEKKLLPKGR